MSAISPPHSPIGAPSSPASASVRAAQTEPGARHGSSLRTASDSEAAAIARATINSLPVSSSINSLTRVLGGITLTLGAQRALPETPTAVREPSASLNAHAAHAVDFYAAIGASTAASGPVQDGPSE